MKSFRKVLTLNVPSRIGFVNITTEVEAALRESGIQEASASSTRCTSPRRSSSMTTNRGSTATTSASSRSSPRTSPSAVTAQRHGEDNADAHIKRQLMGREAVVAVTKGKLDFGTWERIFYGEWDGRRPKRILVKIIGE